MENILKSRAFNSMNLRKRASMKNMMRAIKMTKIAIFRGDIEKIFFSRSFMMRLHPLKFSNNTKHDLKVKVKKGVDKETAGVDISNILKS